MTTIPASVLVAVNPNVLSAGGNGLILNGLLLTESTRVPIGEVLSFPNDGSSVSNYFGPGATETALAEIYFNGFNGSSQKPASILFAQYPGSAVSAYLRGGPVGQMTLAELQSVSPGTITISINGTPHTSSSIDLSGATSFSNAAALILAAFTMPNFGVTYDSVSEAFIFATTSTGATQTIAFPTTNAFVTALLLTSATGAVLSQGADATTPAAFMAALVQVTQNWATFMTVFNPDNSGNANKLAFAEWVNGTDDRYAYIAWDTDITPTESPNATSSLGNIIQTDNLSGTCCIYDPSNGPSIAAFICGAAASIDFGATNGRITFAYRGQDGLVAGVTDATAYENLLANGYNAYCAFATASQQFVMFQNGTVAGPFAWLDSYVNQIWLNNALQLDLMDLLQNTNSIPYNTAGYQMIKDACRETIDEALNFGAIRVGVTLSPQQAAQANAAAGVKIDDILTFQGWYMQVKDASADVRAARQSPPINFWYVDGQSIQQIVLNSILVQ